MADRGPRVLLVEDEELIRTSLRAALEGEQYDVRELSHGLDIASVAADFRPDLAILDIRLPRGPDGYSLAQTLRAVGDLPILFLTAADSLSDRLAGFAAGADDYLVKPFSVAELLARIAALLRRSGRLSSPVWRFGDLTIDDGAHTVNRKGEAIELTRTEYDLLTALARKPGRVLSKTQLLTQVWGFDAYDTNLVEVHISALRRKLEMNGTRLIQTVRGVGYVMRAG